MICYRILTFTGYLYFDRKSCQDEWRREQEARVKKRKFLYWLYDERSTK